MKYDRSDNGTCERCGKAVNMTADPPCPHGVCICDTCPKPAACPDCLVLALEEQVAHMRANGSTSSAYDRAIGLREDALYADTKHERDRALAQLRKDGLL